MDVIRKITIGPDYLNAMHYSVGQDVLRQSHTIHAITMSEIGEYEVWIEDSNEQVFKWKTFNSNIPVSLEYSISF
jgi:hypothetical protein